MFNPIKLLTYRHFLVGTLYQNKGFVEIYQRQSKCASITIAIRIYILIIVIFNIMIRSLLLRRSLMTHTYQRFSLFKKHEPERERRSFHSDAVKGVLFDSDQAKTIDEVNKYFQGIKRNTNYFKCYNEDSFLKATEYKGRKINELPFQGVQSLNSQPEFKVSGITEQIFNKINIDKLKGVLLRMGQQYFEDLITKSRSVKIQPNFDREARRIMSSLVNNGYSFKPYKPAGQPQILLSNVSLFKGIEVIRNKNYTTDSYNVIHEENDKDFHEYKLWLLENQVLAEQELKAQRNMIMRIEAVLKNVSSIQVQKQNQQKDTNQANNVYHNFVFQMNLRHPPHCSAFHLQPSSFLRGYRPNFEELYITNVDWKNPYYSLTYNEQQKKSSLINKLV